jgi:hypothetical protein
MLAKGKQGQGDELEMLHGKGQADSHKIQQSVIYLAGLLLSSPL